MFSILDREHGGVDGTRTRGLCRDRVTGLLFSTTYMSVETAKVRESHVRHRILWVELWVGKSRVRDALGSRGHDALLLVLCPHELLLPRAYLVRTAGYSFFQNPQSCSELASKDPRFSGSNRNTLSSAVNGSHTGAPSAIGTPFLAKLVQ